MAGRRCRQHSRDGDRNSRSRYREQIRHSHRPGCFGCCLRRPACALVGPRGGHTATRPLTRNGPAVGGSGLASAICARCRASRSRDECSRERARRRQPSGEHDRARQRVSGAKIYLHKTQRSKHRRRSRRKTQARQHLGHRWPRPGPASHPSPGCTPQPTLSAPPVIARKPRSVYGSGIWRLNQPSGTLCTLQL